MLGWFKKKFGKSQSAAVPEAAEREQDARHPTDENNISVVEETAAIVVEETTITAVEETAVTAVEETTITAIEEIAVTAVEETPVSPADQVSSSPMMPDELLTEPAVESIPEPLAPPAAEPVESEVVAAQTVDDNADGIQKETDPLPDTGEVVAAMPADAVTQQEGADNSLSPEEQTAASEPVTGRTSVRTQEKPAAKSLFQRLQERLGKTRDAMAYRLDWLFLGKKEIDQDLFEQLEEILITADLGVPITRELLETARKRIKRDQLSDPQALKAIIRDQILAYIESSEHPAELVMPEEGPFVIMVVGINGVGKTTTIGKLAAKFVRVGQSVLLVAGDTFRAAAIDQLKIWGERVGVEVMAQHPGADPSSVIFDGLTYGVSHRCDVIIIDTAGRLHTSVNLMEELKKIKRVIGKKMPGAPHEIMLVLDATTGQNGIAQAKLFHQAVGISGLAVTKLDGTAKGGIVANVCRELGIPVRFIGIGEQIDDLRDFDAGEFVEALFTVQEE